MLSNCFLETRISVKPTRCLCVPHSTSSNNKHSFFVAHLCTQITSQYFVMSADVPTPHHSQRYLFIAVLTLAVTFTNSKLLESFLLISLLVGGIAELRSNVEPSGPHSTNQIPGPDGEIAEPRSNVAKKDIHIHINIKPRPWGRSRGWCPSTVPGPKATCSFTSLPSLFRPHLHLHSNRLRHKPRL